MRTKKEIAIHFLTLAAKGRSREAFRNFVGSGFKHHNAYFKGDGTTLMEAMEEAARMKPNKVFEVQRALEEGELVAVHSRVRQSEEELDIAVIHIFRFENDKIVELWDFGQVAPEVQVNENGMF